MYFSDLGLSDDIVLALTEKGYTKPSPIQEKAIPAVLSGQDIMAAAQTGTGKTAGFTLPILQRLLQSNDSNPVKGNHTRVLILTPTRELAAQISDNIQMYSKHLTLTNDVVFGGVKINPQMMRLRQGVDILVATPGRLLDLHSQNAINFSQLEMLVLDEADRMLDMGFIHDIKKIIKVLPKQRQNLLFSATFSPEIRLLAKQLVNNPVEISVAAENTTASTIEHWLIAVDKNKKSTLLNHLIVEEQWPQVLVFCRTKHGANKLTKVLESKGHKAAAIHGNKSQNARTKALAGFKDKTINVLIATDIAARGIDISQLPYVVNFDLPNVQEDYVHRIGRTGRAGVEGQAVSLVSADEYQQLIDIEHVIQQHISRREVEGFQPQNPLPESRTIRPIKNKKPKKIKGLNDNKAKNVDRNNNSQPKSNNQTNKNKPKVQTNKTNQHKAHQKKAGKNKPSSTKNTTKPNKPKKNQAKTHGKQQDSALDPYHKTR